MSIRLKKTLFRSFLRWNKQPAIANSKFILNSSEFGVDKLLPLEMKMIQNKEGVYKTISYCFRNPVNDPKLASKSIDIAFDSLRKLNTLGEQFKKRVSQEARKRIEVNFQTPLFKESVEFAEVNAIDFSPTARQLPLFLLDGAFFPRGKTALQIFEPRYLKMMEDCQNSDELFGYIHSQDGVVASVGTLCKVVERQVMEDGRQLISINAISRFTVRKVMPEGTAMYTLAEVEPDLKDKMPEIMSEIKDIKDINDINNIKGGLKDIQESLMPEKIEKKDISELEKEVYSYTKYILRLVRISYTLAGQDNPMLDEVVKKYKPSSMDDVLTDNVNRTEENELDRRTNFSFSLLNTIRSVSARESQLLLQTTNISMRLETMKDIIARQADLIAYNLIIEGNLLDVDREKLKAQAFLDDDSDDDIFLPESATNI